MKEQLSSLRQRIESAAKYLHLEDLAKRKAELEKEITQEGFQHNTLGARQIKRELAAASENLSLYDQLERELSDFEIMMQLAEEAKAGGQKELAEQEMQEMEVSVKSLMQKVDELELRSLFSGEYDERDAVCRIKSGAGGNDAQDWAEMLLEMYLRWAEKNNFKVIQHYRNAAEGGGITSAEFVIKGAYAYGNLQGEHGVHRLVRISPYSKEGKRETSFASMTIVPLMEEMEETIEIEDKDLRIDTYRSSGSGGQHANVTDSAVRITHIPSGITATCQAERSQQQNREKAMQMLTARLLDLMRKHRLEELADIVKTEEQVDFGMQIRSYVLHPYQMVKDLRTDYETSNIEGVLEGDIYGFIESYLRWERSKQGYFN